MNSIKRYWAVIKKFLAWNIAFFALIFFSAMHSLVLGDENIFDALGSNVKEEQRALAEKRKEEQLAIIEKKYEEYMSTVEQKYSEEIYLKKRKLSLLQEELTENYLSFDESQKESDKNEQNLIQTSEYSKTLKEEIFDIDFDIKEMENRIAIFEERVKNKEASIAHLAKQKSDLEEEKEMQKEIVLDFFEMYQLKDDELIEQKQGKKMLEIMFTDKSYSEEIRDLSALQAIEKKSRESFHMLDEASSKAKESSLLVQQENEKLLILKEKLERENERLLEQKAKKKYLLSETKNSEKEYQKLWENSVQQMEQSAQEVQSIKEQSEELNKELKTLDRKVRFEKQILTKERIKQKALEKISESPNKELTVEDLGEIFSFESDEYAPLSWPILPTRGISAYFRDPSYKKFFNLNHNAIDIPAPQSTPVHAAAAGYVYKAVDNGKGYSYIILLHRDNIKTVYGHISRIDVKAGDIIQEGEVIGLSGGAPGTNGAGRLTTGAHLHFEVLEGGEWRNPLEYLPLSQLPGK
jgi:murein DD-endopeptidase MepM/ murein hydrolase activator NlpD